MGWKIITLNSIFSSIDIIAIDTAPFIYFPEQHPNHFILIQSIFNYVLRENIEIITSTLALTELLVKPIRAENVYLQREYRNIVMNTQNISPIIINADIAIKATELRAKYNLKTPDALHLATAIVSGADESAAAKKKIMAACGIHVVDSPADLGQTVKNVLG